MAFNFADIADKKIEEVEKPPLPPVGTYHWMINKPLSFETLPGDKWDVVNVPLQGVAAQEDVDPEALRDFGDVRRIFMRHRFMFDKNDEAEFNRGLYNFRRFLEDHVKCATPEMSLKEAMAAAVNGQVLANIIWKPDKVDPETVHANIGKTAPVA